MTLHHSLAGLGILVFTLIALRSTLSDLWKLALLLELPSRKRVASVSVTALSMALILSAPPLVGTKSLGAAMFVLVALVPALSWQLITWWAWFKDAPSIRDGALAIAVERAERFGEAPPRAEHWAPWKDYVFDVEAARRRSIYEPPPI